MRNGPARKVTFGVPSVFDVDDKRLDFQEKLARKPKARTSVSLEKSCLSIVYRPATLQKYSQRMPAPAKNCFLLSITNCLLVSSIAAA
ncbi:unnamed protein product [Brugia pahangi]|uniref:Uncharacterized protein n=1 Tax=Brugia pahangi TaxID=6280 RepID=A0A0N4TMP4_BRUPA|nr:unnamed protein product [Brugia pahangi]